MSDDDPTIERIHANAIRAKLSGGPMDGDEISLSPANSIGPPQRLSYLTTTDSGAAWMVYEANPIIGEWPVVKDHPEVHCVLYFQYIGTFKHETKSRIR